MTSFKKIIQKTVNIKAKTSLKSNIKIWDLNFYYPKNYYFSYIIALKIYIQKLIIKEFYFKKLKTKKPKLVLYTKMIKSLNQNKKNIKKRPRNKNKKILINKKK